VLPAEVSKNLINPSSHVIKIKNKQDYSQTKQSKTTTKKNASLLNRDRNQKKRPERIN